MDLADWAGLVRDIFGGGNDLVTGGGDLSGMMDLAYEGALGGGGGGGCGGCDE